MYGKAFNLDEFNLTKLDPEKIKARFSKDIKKNTQVIVLHGSFHSLLLPTPNAKKTQSFSDCVAPALPFLLQYKHLHCVHFRGDYIYLSKDAEVGDFVGAPGASPEEFKYETPTYQIRGIGDYTREYVKALPPNITYVSFDFIIRPYDEDIIATNVPADLALVCRNLPAWVWRLTIKNVPSPAQIIESIPNTVSFLSLEELEGLYSVSDAGVLKKEGSFCSMMQTLHSCNKLFQLSLANNQLYRLKDESTKTIEKAAHLLPPNLRELNLSKNQMGEMPFESFLLLQAWFYKLHALILSANDLHKFCSQKYLKDFCLWLTTLKVSYLDISNNDIMSRPIEEYKAIISALAPSIKALKSYDSRLSLYRLKERFQLLYLAPHIETLDFSDSNFLDIVNFSSEHGLNCQTDKIASFAMLIQNLFLKDKPSKVKVLDLSGNPLFQFLEKLPVNKPLNELLQSPMVKARMLLFKSFPLQINKIILKRTGLVGLNLRNSVILAILKAIFSCLHDQMIALDLAENGLEELAFTALNNFMKMFPDDLTIHTAMHLRDDGKIIVRSPGLHGLPPPGRLTHQEIFANSLHTFALMMRQKHINSRIMRILLSYLFHAATLQNKVNQICKTSTIIPQSFFENIKSLTTVQADALTAKKNEESVKARIAVKIEESVSARIAVQYDQCTLDLSYCKLGMLSGTAFFHILSNLFNTKPPLPQPNYTVLNLRKNGFHNDRDAFKEGLGGLPDKFKVLDLSGHGFENEDAQGLEDLFAHLSKELRQTILISFDGNRPMRLDEHIALKLPPAECARLKKEVKDTDDEVKQVRIVMQNYTKVGSPFTKLRTLKRSHLPEAKRLPERLGGLDRDNSLENIEDICEENQRFKRHPGEYQRHMTFLGTCKDLNKKKHEEKTVPPESDSSVSVKTSKFLSDDSDTSVSSKASKSPSESTSDESAVSSANSIPPVSEHELEEAEYQTCDESFSPGMS